MFNPCSRLSFKSLSAVLFLSSSLTIFAGPVTQFGRLHTAGAAIVGSNGQRVSLAGNSFFWSQWMGKFYNPSAVAWLVSDWKADIVRAAVGVSPDGYLQNPEREKEHLYAVVDAAIAADIYVIVDWHSHKAHRETEAATRFFQEISRKYGSHPNIIYEIFNEPKDDVTWSRDVKPYAETVIAAIRAVDPVNLIIVGSPHWSQDVDVAADDPIKAENIAYTLHFYAGTHKQGLRDKALHALRKGVPLFVTEWGTCDASGDGAIDEKSTGEWMAFMREWHLSHCNWSVSDKAEAASIVVPGASVTGGWAEKDLTPSGRLVRQWVRTWRDIPVVSAK